MVTTGAGDRVRTGDVQLGKLTLYQLSYSRESVTVLSSAEDKTINLVESGGFEPP
jgi:hypothetical protein